jgi:hypothetical protein
MLPALCRLEKGGTRFPLRAFSSSCFPRTSYAFYLGLAISSITLLQNFERYLRAQRRRNVNQVLCYARRYAIILETGDASPLFLSKSAIVRRHAMESLTVFSKYIGCYDRWQQIRKPYSLHWTDGNESIQALHRFFDTNLTLDLMLQRVKGMMCALPSSMALVVRHALLTGLRTSELCKSVRLLNEKVRESFTTNYYNPEQQCLFTALQIPRYLFARNEKAYLSFITLDNLQPIVNLGNKTPHSGGHKFRM